MTGKIINISDAIREALENQHTIYAREVLPFEKMRTKHLTYLIGENIRTVPVVIHASARYLWVILPDIPLVAEWKTTAKTAQSLKKFDGRFKKLYINEHSVSKIASQKPFVNWISIDDVRIEDWKNNILSKVLDTILLSLPRGYYLSDRTLAVFAPLQINYPERYSEPTTQLIAELGRIRLTHEHKVLLEVMTGINYEIWGNTIMISGVKYARVPVKKDLLVRLREELLDQPSGWKSVIVHYTTTAKESSHKLQYEVLSVAPVVGTTEGEIKAISSLLGHTTGFYANQNINGLISDPVKVILSHKVYEYLFSPFKGPEFLEKEFRKALSYEKECTSTQYTFEFLHPAIAYHTLKFMFLKVPTLKVHFAFVDEVLDKYKMDDNYTTRDVLENITAKIHGKTYEKLFYGVLELPKKSMQVLRAADQAIQQWYLVINASGQMID